MKEIPLSSWRTVWSPIFLPFPWDRWRKHNFVLEKGGWLSLGIDEGNTILYQRKVGDKIGQFCLAIQAWYKCVKAESATPAKISSPVICTMHIKDNVVQITSGLLLKEGTCVRRDIYHLPREPSHKNATRPDKPFIRVLGWDWRVKQQSSQQTWYALNCTKDACHKCACMHACNWNSVNNWLPIKKT